MVDVVFFFIAFSWRIIAIGNRQPKIWPLLYAYDDDDCTATSNLVSHSNEPNNKMTKMPKKHVQMVFKSRN